MIRDNRLGPTGLDRLEVKVDKIADTLSQMLADHEQRITRLEGRR